MHVALLDVAEEGEADAFRGDGAVADQSAACLLEERDEEDEEGGGEDGKEPEYGSPAQVMRQGTAEKRTKGGSEENTGQSVAHVSASFGGGGNICNDCHRQGDGGAVTGRLDSSQNEESGVVGLQCETDICNEEDAEADYERKPTACCV
jgi:hypothetical protein